MFNIVGKITHTFSGSHIYPPSLPFENNQMEWRVDDGSSTGKI